MAEVLFKF